MFGKCYILKFLRLVLSTSVTFIVQWPLIWIIQKYTVRVKSWNVMRSSCEWNWLERLVSKMTYYVSSAMLNSTNSTQLVWVKLVYSVFPFFSQISAVNIIIFWFWYFSTYCLIIWNMWQHSWQFVYLFMSILFIKCLEMCVSVVKMPLQILNKNFHFFAKSCTVQWQKFVPRIHRNNKGRSDWKNLRNVMEFHNAWPVITLVLWASVLAIYYCCCAVLSCCVITDDTSFSVSAFVISVDSHQIVCSA